MEFPEETVKQIKNCAFCYLMCRHYCTIASVQRVNYSTPTGKAILLYKLMNNEIRISENLTYLFYNCTNCGRCYVACETKASNPPEYLEEVRYRLVEDGMVPRRIEELMEKIVRYGNVYGASEDVLLEKLSSSENIFKSDSRILYYAGGDIRSKHPEIAEETIKLLRKLSVNVKVLESEPPDGNMLYILGFREQARRMAMNLLEEVRKHKISKIIVSDPLAYANFKVYYPKMGVTLADIEVVHILEFISKKTMKFDKLAATAVYHDPCFLGRRSTGIYEAPRMLLNKIPGLKLMKVAFEKEHALCCGGLLRPISEHWANKVAENLARMLRSAPADLVVTACPRCLDSLNSVRVKAVDIISILNEHYLVGA